MTLNSRPGPYLDRGRTIETVADNLLAEVSELTRGCRVRHLSRHRPLFGRVVAVWSVDSAPPKRRHLSDHQACADEAHQRHGSERRHVVVVGLIGEARTAVLIGAPHPRQINARGVRKDEPVPTPSVRDAARTSTRSDRRR